MLQHLYNLSDDGIEDQIRNRFSFILWVCNLPDSKTVWTFREIIKILNLVEVLFARFHEQFAEQEDVARAGQS